MSIHQQMFLPSQFLPDMRPQHRIRRLLQTPQSPTANRTPQLARSNHNLVHIQTLQNIQPFTVRSKHNLLIVLTKILLINPPGRFPEQPPYGLMCLAAYVEQAGHTVRLLDMPLGDMPGDYINQYKPDVVGISSTTCSIGSAHNLANHCRESGIYTVMGGPMPSSTPELSLQYCNAVVKGEGEKTFTKLIETRETGIFEGEAVSNLDELPIPAFHLLQNEHYLTIRRKIHNSIMTFAGVEDRIGTFMGSRGCPFRCSYCYNSTRQSPPRYMSAEKLISHLEFLTNKYHIDCFLFIDDDFLSNKPRLEKFCKLKQEKHLNFYWSANSRVTDVTDNILELIKPAGGIQLAFGFESGNNRILEVLNKQATVERAKTAIETCQKHGIIVQGNFMFGNPTETEAEMRDTLKFAEENTIDGGIGGASTVPFPGTKIFEWCIQNGKLGKEVDFGKFDYSSTPIFMADMEKEKFLGFMKEVGQRFSNILEKNTPLRTKKLGDWKKSSL